MITGCNGWSIKVTCPTYKPKLQLLDKKVQVQCVYEILCYRYNVLLLATMSTGSDIESLTCRLCAQLYTDPSMLPCLHSFCSKCLLKLMAEKQEAITCPSCNELASIPRDGVFPTNVCLAKEVKEHKLKMKFATPTQCEGCVTSTAAVVYCSQCCEFLCTMCRDHHNVSRKTKDHKLVDAKEREKNISLPETPLNCPIPHHGELRLYCENCNTVICSDCTIFGSHKNHKCSDCNECRTDIHNSVQQCTQSVTTLDDAIQSANNLIHQIQARKKQIDQEINSTFDGLQVALSDRRKALLKESHNIATAKVTAVHIQLETFHKLKQRLSSATKLVTDTLQSHQSSELLSTKKTIEDRLDKLKREFDEVSCILTEDDTIVASLDGTLHDEISRYGEVSDINVASSLSAIESGIAVPLATVKKVRKFKYSVRDRSGSPVNGKVPIAASVVRHGDRKKVEVVTSKEDQCTLTCTPDTVGEYELSVKVRGTHIKNSPYRMWVRQERDLRNLPQQHVYNVGSYAFGVSVHSNGDVFATGDNGYVQVYNKDGSKKTQIGTRGSGDGQFSSPRGIVLVGDIMYVVDRDNNRVQKLTISGEYIGQFGGKGSGEGKLAGAYGIAYNGNNHIIVADYNNKCVVVYTLDGTFIKAINCDDYVLGVAVDNDGNIHVPLYNKHIVQVFSSDGTKLYSYSNRQGNFNNPQGIAIDDNGYRYITTPQYLHILDHTGNHVNVIGGFSNPYEVALDAEGYMYVSDYSNSRVIKY